MVTSQITEDIRKTATGTGYAVVGLTDLAVERVRDAQARAGAVRAELEVKKLQSRVQHAPTAAVTGALEAAGKVEETYGALSARGRGLVERIRTQRASQEFRTQGRSTVRRTKAAVTTARHGAEDTSASAKATATTAQRQAKAAAEDTRATATKRAKTTRTAAKRTSTTARKRSAPTVSAAKGAATSARKTTKTAAKATEAAAEKVGD